MNQRYSQQGFPPYQWTVNEGAPLTRMRKPLSECRVSMLTYGGVSQCSMPAWDAFARNDFRVDLPYRWDGDFTGTVERTLLAMTPSQG